MDNVCNRRLFSFPSLLIPSVSLTVLLCTQFSILLFFLRALFSPFFLVPINLQEICFKKLKTLPMQGGGGGGMLVSLSFYLQVLCSVYSLRFLV